MTSMSSTIGHRSFHEIYNCSGVGSSIGHSSASYADQRLQSYGLQ